MALRPLHHRRNRNAEPRRNQPAAIAGQNRRHNTLTQIGRKGSRHPMLASTPASILMKWTPPRAGIDVP
jgi:hypothetical protein